MSTNTFGLNPAPVGTSVTKPFTNPVVPSPVPSAGTAKGFSSLPTVNPVPNTQPMNPVMSAAAGPKCNIVWVESIDEVLSYPTSPNEEMYFQDNNNPVIYRRETDANGNIKNPIHALHYTVEEVPFGPEAQFVTKDEHKQLYDLVEKLSHTVDGMNGKLEKLLNG